MIVCSTEYEKLVPHLETKLIPCGVDSDKGQQREVLPQKVQTHKTYPSGVSADDNSCCRMETELQAAQVRAQADGEMGSHCLWEVHASACMICSAGLAWHKQAKPHTIG